MFLIFFLEISLTFLLQKNIEVYFKDGTFQQISILKETTASEVTSQLTERMAKENNELRKHFVLLENYENSGRGTFQGH